MALAVNEKRATRRVDIELPMTLHLPSTDLQTTAATRNISARGVLFLANSRFSEGSSIQFSLKLPPEITKVEEILTRCTGRVVRVATESLSGKYAVAAIIERYEFLGQTQSS